MSPVTISVLITNYNYSSYIQRAIESVLNQTVRPHEIIVYDDGSTDSSIELIKMYPVRLISGEHRGVAYSRNRLLRQATGSHVLILDADDWIELNMLETAIAKINSNSGIRAIYCNYAHCIEKTVPYFPVINRKTPSKLDIRNCYKSIHYIPCHTVVFPRIWAVPFDETLSTSEDQAFWVEILLRGATFHYVPKVLSIYRIHKKSRSSNRKLESLQNQVMIHKLLIEKYPSAEKYISFMKHVRWRRYKLILEYFRSGEKKLALKVFVNNVSVLGTDFFKRLFIIGLFCIFPCNFIKKMTYFLGNKKFNSVVS